MCEAIIQIFFFVDFCIIIIKYVRGYTYYQSKKWIPLAIQLIVISTNYIVYLYILKQTFFFIFFPFKNIFCLKN